MSDWRDTEEEPAKLILHGYLKDKYPKLRAKDIRIMDFRGSIEYGNYQFWAETPVYTGVDIYMVQRYYLTEPAAVTEYYEAPVSGMIV